jgi:hypothetical protein
MRTAATVIILLTILAGPASTAWGQQPLEPTLGISDDREGADVLGAFTDSLKLLMIEHGSRVAFQQKTRKRTGRQFLE